MGNQDYTFGAQDYIKFMPVADTDQARGRQHECPICGVRRWSVFGHADKHWQTHRVRAGGREGAQKDVWEYGHDPEKCEGCPLFDDEWKYWEVVREDPTCKGCNYQYRERWRLMQALGQEEQG